MWPRIWSAIFLTVAIAIALFAISIAYNRPIRDSKVGATGGQCRPSAARLLLERGGAMQASLPQWAVGDRHPLDMCPVVE
jgi:hypothetical protein